MNLSRRDFLRLSAPAALLTMAHTIYTPFIGGQQRTRKSNVGVEIESSAATLDKYYNPYTRLKVSVRWSEVEAQRGQYDWSTLDSKLGNYHADWITVKTTPEWALDDEPMCKLPGGKHWADFHRFVQAVIDRYQPGYIEIWNEPNVTESPFPAQFGCVGDAPLYGEFVEKLYGNVTGAKIIIGAVSSIDDDYIAAMLVEAKGKFDGISFHCYEYFYNGISDTCRDQYRRLAKMTDKPVYLSETAVIYREGKVSDYYDAQIKHYQRLKELPTLWFWYTLGYNAWPSPISTDMIGPDGPRHIWYAYAAER